MHNIYFINYFSEIFPQIFDHLMEKATAFSVFYQNGDVTSVDDMSDYKTELLSIDSSMTTHHSDDLHRTEFTIQITPETLKLFKACVMEGYNNDGNCGLWHFTVFAGDTAIMKFQDYAECLCLIEDERFREICNERSKMETGVFLANLVEM